MYPNNNEPAEVSEFEVNVLQSSQGLIFCSFWDRSEYTTEGQAAGEIRVPLYSRCSDPVQCTTNNLAQGGSQYIVRFEKHPTSVKWVFRVKGWEVSTERAFKIFCL